MLAEFPHAAQRRTDQGFILYRLFNSEEKLFDGPPGSKGFSKGLQKDIAQLAQLTPHNRDLANRLLRVLVKNRKLKLLEAKNANPVIEVTRGDIERSITHMKKFNETCAKHPGHWEEPETQATVKYNGEHATEFMEYKMYDGNLDDTGQPLENDEDLEHMLLYQHQLSEAHHALARQEQLGWYERA